MSNVIVRYAPSPTGIPHIGNIRTALFNYLFAKSQNGKFLLRIEDTDRARLVVESIAKIEESLGKLGIVWDERYVQSGRLPLYNSALEILKKAGAVYEDSGAWRFRVSKNIELSWEDGLHGLIEFSSSVIEDFVIVKSDGFPTYHFASVVDDHDMRISHVIRGDEWVSSTPKHLLLYSAFSWQAPLFVHLPPILGPNKKKLSKREGVRSVFEYLSEGYLPEAIVNFLALLGWSPKSDKELFTLDELTREFSLERLNKNSPIFNLEKLNWFNKKYLQKLSSEELVRRIKQFSTFDTFHLRGAKAHLGGVRVREESNLPAGKAGVISEVKMDDQRLAMIVNLVRDRMTILTDFGKYSSIFFEKGEQAPPEKSKIEDAKAAIESIEAWNEESIGKLLDQWIKDKNLVSSDFKNTLRLAVFADNTPPIYPSLAVLAKKEVLARIRDALAKSSL